MKKFLMAIALCAIIPVFVSCIGTAPIEGMKSPIGANWKAPLNTNLKDITFGSKVGKASVRCFAFGLYSSGDMSIKAAAENAGITTIKHVDYEYNNIFFFAYQEITTIVYGD